MMAFLFSRCNLTNFFVRLVSKNFVMKGFIKITQSNNQGTYINVSNIIKFYRKTQDHTGIVTTDSVEIECKQTVEEIEKLIDNASTL